MVTVSQFCRDHCSNTFDRYIPVAIHQVKSSAPTYFEMPQINHFHQLQPSAYSPGSHQYTGCLRCFTAFLSRVPLGTDKALMPLIAPVKNRNKYKEWREKHSDAPSIQAVIQLPEWRQCGEGSSALSLHISLPANGTKAGAHLPLPWQWCARMLVDAGGECRGIQCSATASFSITRPAAPHISSVLNRAALHAMGTSKGKLCSWVAPRDNLSSLALLVDLLYRICPSKATKQGW